MVLTSASELMLPLSLVSVPIDIPLEKLIFPVQEVATWRSFGIRMGFLSTFPLRDAVTPGLDSVQFLWMLPQSRWVHMCIIVLSKMLVSGVLHLHCLLKSLSPLLMAPRALGGAVDGDISFRTECSQPLTLSTPMSCGPLYLLPLIARWKLMLADVGWVRNWSMGKMPLAVYYCYVALAEL